MKKETIGTRIASVVIAPESHDSARRAIKKILRRSKGRVPKSDLRDILKIVLVAI